MEHLSFVGVSIDICYGLSPFLVFVLHRHSSTRTVRGVRKNESLDEGKRVRQNSGSNRECYPDILVLVFETETDT
jgi:hypothetical protein